MRANKKEDNSLYTFEYPHYLAPSIIPWIAKKGAWLKSENIIYEVTQVSIEPIDGKLPALELSEVKIAKKEKEEKKEEEKEKEIKRGLDSS